MLDDLPLFSLLNDREIHVLESLLGGPQTFTLNGHSKDLEKSILAKTKTKSVEELISLLHREVIRSNVTEDAKSRSIDYFLKDPRFERFQVFVDQGVRILDNSTHQYLYVNKGSQNLMGWTPDEIKQGGLTFGHRKTHPWDLFQVVLLSRKVLKTWKTLSDVDKLNSRFSFDIRIRHKDGKYRRIQQHAYTLSLTEDGKPGLLMMISNDITQYKSSTKIQYVFGVTREHRFDILLNGETRPHSSPLSVRETDIVHQIAQGYTENEIAGLLNISMQTVKTHRKNILAKTNCKNTAELIRTAMMEGWI